MKLRPATLLLSAAIIVGAAPLSPAHSQGNRTPNKTKVPPAEVLDLYDIAQLPSAQRIIDDIQTLVDFGTRHTLSETKSAKRGIGAARRWIFDEFTAISKSCGGCGVIEAARILSKRKYAGSIIYAGLSG